MFCRQDVVIFARLDADAKNIAFDLYIYVKIRDSIAGSQIILAVVLSSGVSFRPDERYPERMLNYSSRIIEVSTMKGLRDTRSDWLLFIVI